ncbi:hypothetical protein BS47DRAFT_1356987 [Hydnum rufescens UP504]|uniref:Uncharacterized protein n=1 Tax=Hydnum rufescens UP504 TaxID=1448309 RepID=A0A9P6DZY8_9AGAM|nr:hypothetical protein BS47DRAFT_1356987 [Hydnum rufescens UP504]
MTSQDHPRPDLGDIGFPTFHKDVFPRNGYQHASKPVVHVYTNRTREGRTTCDIYGNREPGQDRTCCHWPKGWTYTAKPSAMDRMGYSVTQSPPRLNKVAKSQYNESGSIRTPMTHRVDATAIFKNGILESRRSELFNSSRTVKPKWTKRSSRPQHFVTTMSMAVARKDEHMP